jgi:hypothetical protein
MRWMMWQAVSARPYLAKEVAEGEVGRPVVGDAVAAQVGGVAHQPVHRARTLTPGLIAHSAPVYPYTLAASSSLAWLVVRKSMTKCLKLSLLGVMWPLFTQES